MDKSLDTDLSQALIPLRSLDIISDVQGRIEDPPFIDRQSSFFFCGEGCDQGATKSAPRFMSPNAEEEGGCGVSANENSCAHHVTWSPNKLCRSTSIFNLWLR